MSPGRYLLGILHSGEIFIWHKDKDVVRILPELEKIAPDFLSGMAYKCCGSSEISEINPCEILIMLKIDFNSVDIKYKQG